MKRTTMDHGMFRRGTRAALGALLGVLVTAGTVHAEPLGVAGIALEAKALAPRVSSDLRAQIVKARATDAKSFQDVRALVVRAPELHARGRGGRVPIALVLAKMGKGALLPMLDVLVFDAPAELSQEHRSTVRRDVVEAVGLLRDARALPVLSALLERDAEPSMIRTVAEAVARQDSAEAAALLVDAFARSTGERQVAIARGMGMCHKEAVASALADKLASRPSTPLAMGTILALGHVGNAWAWKTLADRSEETNTRALAAKALVNAFVASSDEDVREAAAKSLLLVDAPSTPDLIRDARGGAPAKTLEALDRLSQRFANNPAR